MSNGGSRITVVLRDVSDEEVVTLQDKIADVVADYGVGPNGGTVRVSVQAGPWTEEPSEVDDSLREADPGEWLRLMQQEARHRREADRVRREVWPRNHDATAEHPTINGRRHSVLPEFAATEGLTDG